MHLSPRTLLVRGVGLLALGLLLTVTGCGPSRGSVSGTVSYRGQTLKAGRVIFFNSSEKQGYPAEIDETGKYTVSKIPAGDYKVCVETEYLRPSPQANLAAKTRPKEVQATGTDPASRSKYYVPIPKEFASPEDTKLEFKATGGNQDYNIKLD